MQVLGGIELGGTKVRCAVAQRADTARTECVIATTTPAQTLAAVRDFFRPHSLSALGIASFGPLQQNPSEPDYGRILDTPKLAWQGVDLRAAFETLDVPIGVDTDVNAAALAEWRFGAGRDMRSICYVTVGTGIGAGVLVDGRPLPGRTHAEVGHMWVKHDRSVDPWPGNCPFHGDCLEGLAAGEAIKARWGRAAEQLDADHPAWTLQSDYLAQLCVNLTRVVAPQRIILGGGVMQHRALHAWVRQRFTELMGDYHAAAAVNVADYIAAPALGDVSGLVGALCLAEMRLTVRG